jgi:hypothetical protein
VIEAEQDVRDEQTALRDLRTFLRQRHRRLERRDCVVAEVPDDRLAERLSLLERDESRAGADEAVPTDAPALDRLEQEQPSAPSRSRRYARVGSGGRLQSRFRT